LCKLGYNPGMSMSVFVRHCHTVFARAWGMLPFYRYTDVTK